MKTIGFVALVISVVAQAFAQHYNWSAHVGDGVEYNQVHPDTIRADSLSVSTSRGEVRWLRIDSIRSLVYDYNPTVVTLCLAGSMIGLAVANDQQEPTIRDGVTGTAIGCVSGYVLSAVLGRWR